MSEAKEGCARGSLLLCQYSKRLEKSNGNFEIKSICINNPKKGELEAVKKVNDGDMAEVRQGDKVKYSIVVSNKEKNSL